MHNKIINSPGLTSRPESNEVSREPGVTVSTEGAGAGIEKLRPVKRGRGGACHGQSEKLCRPWCQCAVYDEHLFRTIFDRDCAERPQTNTYSTAHDQSES